MMIGFILSVIMGLILIPLLKRLKIKQKVSVFLKKRHQEKNGTPTMGGLIFIIPTILTVIILLFMNKIELTENLFIVMFVFIAYALLGFIDDYLSIKRGHNEGLTEIQKLFGQLLIALIFFYIFMRSGSSPVLDIHTLGIKINMGWFYGIFLAFALISWNSKYVAGSEDIAIFCFILVGSLLGFLLFNTHPAKVFMGDTGSLALGGTLASVAIITSHEITLIIVAGVFVVETLACIIQMISVRYFHRKVFLMAPLHHHFEKLGWDERDVVKVFWTVGLMLSMAAIAFGVWI